MEPFNSTSSLEAIAEYLKAEEFPVYLPKPTPDLQLDQLYVGLFKDEAGRDYVLQVVYVNDLAKSTGVTAEENEILLLQFFVSFPFKAEQTFLGDISSLILTINRILPLGAFGLSQKEGTIYFQYILASETKQISKLVSVEVTNIIGMFVKEFAPKLASVATGEKTVDEVLKEMESTGLVIPSVEPMPTVDPDANKR